MDLQAILYAIIGGILPSLIWLWFWLKEDKKDPEPTYALVKAFIAGALAVPVAIFLEKFAQEYVGNIFSKDLALPITIFLWATIEELLKFAFAYFSSLKNSYNDEPIDSMVYMITVALGFAAIENALFLLGPAKTQVVDSLLTGNLRFLGATLLHILASSIIGVALAFTFKKSGKVKLIAVAFSVILAVAAHFAFNYSLSVLNVQLMQIFAFIWLALVALLIVFEKVKKIIF